MTIKILHFGKLLATYLLEDRQGTNERTPDTDVHEFQHSTALRPFCFVCHMMRSPTMPTKKPSHSKPCIQSLTPASHQTGSQYPMAFGAQEPGCQNHEGTSQANPKSVLQPTFWSHSHAHGPHGSRINAALQKGAYLEVEAGDMRNTKLKYYFTLLYIELFKECQINDVGWLLFLSLIHWCFNIDNYKFEIIQNPPSNVVGQGFQEPADPQHGPVFETNSMVLRGFYFHSSSPRLLDKK